MSTMPSGQLGAVAALGTGEALASGAAAGGALSGFGASLLASLRLSRKKPTTPSAATPPNTPTTRPVLLLLEGPPGVTVEGELVVVLSVRGVPPNGALCVRGAPTKGISPVCSTVSENEPAAAASSSLQNSRARA